MGIFNLFKKVKSTNTFGQKDQRKAECPYCHKSLEKMPNQKTKCPHCNRFIFVRTDPVSRARVLATESRVKMIEKQWKRMSLLNEWRRRLLDEFDVTEEDFRVTKENLSKKFGREAQDDDVIWKLFIQLKIASMRKNDWDKITMISYNQALFINDVGRDCFYVLKTYAEEKLTSLKIQGFKKVKISSAKDVACEECRKQDGKEFTIQDALKKMPLPCKKCTFKFDQNKKPFCRCLYSPVTD